MMHDYLFIKKLVDNRHFCPACNEELVMTSIISVDACYYQCPVCRTEYYYCNGDFREK